MEYFSHDYGTRTDEKIIELMADLGWEGYGLYWGIVELLYQNNGKMQTQYKRIAYALNSDEVLIRQIIENYDLFLNDNTDFWSDSVIKRLEQREDKSAKARQSANKRWKDAKAMRPHNERNAKKKRKEIKKEINIPTWVEFKEYAFSKKSLIDTQALKLKYDSWVENDWRDGNDNRIKNWKSKLLNTLPYLPEKKTFDRAKTEKVDVKEVSKTATTLDPERKKRIFQSIDNIGKE